MKKIIGKYELGSTLGEGTFGRVKKAVHIETKQEFAIKIIDKAKVREQNMGLQIKREVNIMKQIGLTEENINVVKLYEVLASKSKIYLVLEYAKGGELFNHIAKEKRFSEKRALHYFKQLVTSVSLCHNVGVCHRDLKPENLLLDENDNLKISDFGLSALYSIGDGSMLSCRVELLHTTCGTPNYVAPEVLESDGYDGRKADIWSIGVILYVMTVGALPFDEKTLPKLFQRIKSADYVIPSFLSTDLSDLITIILREDPKRRASMKDIMSHPWFRQDYDDEEDDHQSQKRANFIFQGSSMKQGDDENRFYFNLESKFSNVDVMRSIHTRLIQLGFKLDKKDNVLTVGATKITRCGMIGVFVTIDDSERGKKIEFKRCRGDIIQFNRIFKDLMHEKNWIASHTY